MLEFIQKEIWVIEKEDINRSKLFNFFLPDNRAALLAVNAAGKFHELITYEGLLQGKDMRSYVVCGSDMFDKANRFYDVLDNRELLLPILNTEFEIISFFRWNAQIERATFRMQDCDGVRNIFISGCDEVNIRILQQLDAAQIYKEKQIFLCGEGWEVVLSYIKLSGSYEVVEQLPQKQEAVLIKSGGGIDLHTAESYVTTYTLKEEFKSKRIFVYGANLNGQMILANLEFMGVHVHGIIDDECEEENSFLIWPIVKSKDIIGQPDIIVVCAGFLHSKIYQLLGDACALVVYENIFQWDETLNKEKYILIYESVNALEEVKKKINLCGGEVSGEFLVHNLTKDKIEELKKEKANLVFALPSAEVLKYNKSCNVLSERLKRNIYRTTPYLCSDFHRLEVTNPFVRINNAKTQGRKIFLYGIKETYGAVWQKLFRYLGIDFDGMVDDNPGEQSGIKSVYDLMYEEIDSVFLILGFDAYKWHMICNNLESMGFSDRNVLGMLEFSASVLDAVVDIQLGHVILCEGEEIQQYPGFHIIGGERKNNYKIVTLGGSTTDDAIYRGKLRSWPQCLFDKLKSEKEIVIYNAAVSGYTSCQEVLKLLRDVCALRADLIISFSGVNDLLVRENDNPFLSGYLADVWKQLPISHWGGISKQLSEGKELRGFDFWYTMEEIMYSISSIFGAKFLCFAQPIMFSQEKLSQERRWEFERIEAKKSAIEFRKKAGRIEKDWFVNLTDILDNEPQVFVDFVHVDEEGNNIIADHIYRHIEHILQQRRE